MRILLSLFSATFIWAADVTGSWSGPIETTRDGETLSGAALLILKQEGTKITGSIGPHPGSRTEISKGSIEGADITLEAVVPDGELRITIRLKLDGDKLAGELKVDGPAGPQITGKLKLERAK